MNNEKNFTFLVTGKKNNDYAARKYIGQDTPHIFFKLSYTPPYETFNGIRAFQVSTRFRPFEDTTQTSKYAVINLSEWIGHESEEFLEVFMKFLHDYSGFFQFRYIFTVGDATKNQTKKLVILASQYLEKGGIYEDLTFVNHHAMAGYLERSYQVERRCAEKLAEMFTVASVDGYTQLHTIMKEIRHLRGKRELVTENLILNKSCMEDTKLYLLFEEEINKWRERDNEKNDL